MGREVNVCEAIVGLHGQGSLAIGSPKSEELGESTNYQIFVHLLDQSHIRRVKEMLEDLSSFSTVHIWEEKSEVEKLLVFQKTDCTLPT